MEIPELSALIKAFKQAGLTKLEIKNKDEKIVLEKQSKVIQAPSTQNLTTTVKDHQSSSNMTATKKEDQMANEEIVKAPFIGTFYLASKPGAKPFVQVGDQITAGQQLGIIEAMKMMNEIKSPTAGKVIKVLVTDGTAVEYDQPLFVILK